MPELPDITVYCEALARRVVDRPLVGVRIGNPFLLRSVNPPLGAFAGLPVRAVERLGKRIVFRFDDDLALVLHLMIAGRLRWKTAGAPIPKRGGLAAFDFEAGAAILTEAGSKRRASLYAVRGIDALAEHDRGGYEVLDGNRAGFGERLQSENRTLKRALTNPRLFSGIGNAYSDELLFAARLSPVKLTSRLTDEEIDRLHAATCDVLVRFTETMRAELGDGFPDKVTAFRPDMAVHGRYGEPCVECGRDVQRVRYATRECNYCAVCQNAGRLLADRALSRLMKKDWPRTLDALEAFKRERRR